MQIFKSREFRLLLPHFLLAFAVIITFRVVSDFDIFLEMGGQVWQTVTPFFHGFLLAYILNVPCSGIQTLFGKSKVAFISKRRKLLGIIITYLLFFSVLFLVSSLILPSIYNSVVLFVENLQTYWGSMQQLIAYGNQIEILGMQINVEEFVAEIFEGFSMEELLALVGNFNMENWVFSAVADVSNAIFNGFLAFISSIYILVEKDKFKQFLRRLLTAFTAKVVYIPVLKYAEALNKNFKQYIHTQTIDGFILGTVVTIQLQLLGSPYALILGIMLGLFNYIPYFGSIVATLIAVLVVAFTQGLTAGAITAVVLLITQQIDANILQPRLMGGSFSLSPLLVIICITIGGAYAGILGMVAAIPIAAVLKDMLESAIVHFEQKKSPEP